jgi:hypothetical protein
MTADEYLNGQPENRQAIMKALHAAILSHDKSVTYAVEPMMGKEMILYKQFNYMKYGVAGVKNHMSLHCLPMYMKPEIRTKYEQMMPEANFQKGCINFTSAQELPIDIAINLFTDCAVINIADVLEKRKKK